MNKPLTMIIKETQNSVVNALNESGLPPIILDFIVRDIYTEVHNITERQATEDVENYKKSLEEETKKKIEDKAVTKE